jgi:hypothetical protein
MECFFLEKIVTRKAGLAPAYRMKQWLRISQVLDACDIADKEAIDSIIGRCKTRPTDYGNVGNVVKPGSEWTFLMSPHPKAIGSSQGIDEVNEKEPAALLSNGPPLTAFVGMSRNQSGLIGSG